jgi:hypothetical protein
MKSLLEFIVRNIVQFPDEVVITQSTDQEGVEVFNISLNPEDMGRVIGKGGKVINSIRTIMRVKATASKTRFLVELTQIS